MITDTNEPVAAAERPLDCPAIAELVGVLKAAEELYRVGLFGAEPGQIQQVVSMRQAAIAKYDMPTKAQN